MWVFALIWINLLLQGPTEIDYFGENGAGVPYFLGSLPSQEFFHTPPFEAFVYHVDYTGYLDLKTIVGSDLIVSSLFIVLGNSGDSLNSVMVSAEFSGEFRNFLIRLNPKESMIVKATSLISASSLRFISINAFRAYVYSNDNHRLGVNIKILPPFGGSSGDAVGICYERTDIMRIENWLGETEDAWFKRFKSGVTNCSFGPDSSAFEIDIYWPNAQTRHHAGNGAHPHCNAETCQTHNTCIPKCQMFGYSTTNVTGTGNILLWRNINYTTPIPNKDRSFDSVLYEGVCGKAFCRTIFPGGTLCLDDSGNVNPNIFWYVYHPQTQPCP